MNKTEQQSPDGELRVVVPAAEARALFDSRSRIEEARAEAEQILAEAREEAEQLRSAALAQGQQEAAALVTAAAADTRQFIRSLEASLNSLIIQLLQQILDSFSDRELLASLVKRALRDMYSEQQLVLTSDTETCRILGEVLDKNTLELIRFDADPRLPAGTMSLSGPAATIDISRAAQLEQLARALNSAGAGNEHG